MVQLFVIVAYSAGAAYKDGRLRPGDQILEVMKEDLRNVTHSFALHALRQTPNKVRYHQLCVSYRLILLLSLFFQCCGIGSVWIRIRMNPHCFWVGKIRIQEG
jgi:hypothetical protein